MKIKEIMKIPYQIYWGLVKKVQATLHFKSSQKDLNKVLLQMYSDKSEQCVWEYSQEKGKWKITIPHSTEQRVVYAYTGDKGIWQANMETGEKVDVYEIYQRNKRKESTEEFAWERIKKEEC